MFALKLARAAGLKIFLTSSSDEKLKDVSERFPGPPIQTINYSKVPEWHEEVLWLTDGVGVDLVIEVGGANSLLISLIPCSLSTRRRKPLRAFGRARWWESWCCSCDTHAQAGSADQQSCLPVRMSKPRISSMLTTLYVLVCSHRARYAMVLTCT